MSRTKQPVEALIVQYFTEQPLAACESVKRIVDDVMKRRLVAWCKEGDPIKQEREQGPRRKRTSQKPTLLAPPQPVDLSDGDN